MSKICNQNYQEVALEFREHLKHRVTHIRIPLLKEYEKEKNKKKKKRRKDNCSTSYTGTKSNS